MRAMFSTQKDLFLALERIQDLQLEHEEKIALIFSYIKKIQDTR